MTWATVIGSLLARPNRPAIVADERALLDAVIAAPGDDAPRLVYADWLQHRDELAAARGELIAVQCTLAHLDDPIEHNRLKARDFELVKRHGNVWCAQVGIGEVRNNWYPSAWAADFQRGFIETVEMPAGAFSSVVPRLFDLEPVRALVLIGLRPDDARRLPESIYLRRLRAFGLRNSRVSDEVLVAVFGSPMLAGLDRLHVADQTLDPSVLEVIGRTGVRELSLRNTNLYPTALFTLLRTPLMPRLEVLELDGNPIGDSGVRALVDAPLGRLRRLSLVGSLVGLALDETVRRQLVERFGAVDF